LYVYVCVYVYGEAAGLIIVSTPFYCPHSSH
jgi:hypothetical protein